MESSSISSLQTLSISQPQAITDSSSVKRKRDSEVPISGVEGSSNKKLKKFLRDPRICITDRTRLNPPAPLSQNVKDNEPNLPRAEGKAIAKRTEYCEDYYLSEVGCTDVMCGKAHGDCEVGEPFFMPPEDAIVFRPVSGKTEGRTGKCDHIPFHAKVFPYIDASHVGILFGQKGEIFQWLCNLTGAKVTVENNKGEVPGFKKVVISGPFSSCLAAEVLLTTLLANFIFFTESDKIPPVLDYKVVLCKKYAEGCCERDAGTCCFAHGASDLRPRSVELLQKALTAKRKGKYYNAATKTFVRKKKEVTTTKDSYPRHCF